MGTRFAANARELSSRAPWWSAFLLFRAARPGFAWPRHISSPARKPRSALAYAPAFVVARDGVYSPAVLEALRVDVDDDAEAGAAHRRRGGTQQPSRLRRQAARLVGLRDQLRAELPAQAQQRGRAEQVAR